MRIMISALENEFTKLEHQLAELQQMVKPLSAAQQNFRPETDGWSILQVFRHLIQSEGQINRYLHKKILGAPAAGTAGLSARIRSLILNFAMRLPLRYKAPEVIKVDFEVHYDYEPLITAWQQQRLDLRAFLETIDEANAKKELFRHPVAGLMSLSQGLTFMQEHLDRHARQVGRIMRSSGFPKK